MRFRKTPVFVAAITVTILVLIVIYRAEIKSNFGPIQARAEQLKPSLASSQSPSTVVLDESQIKSLKIEPVGKHLFLDEREAVGSIDFDEDLSIIQAEAALIGAAGNFDVTSKELSRAKTLYGTNVGVSQRELDQAVADQQTAAAALKAARESVRILGKTDAEIDQLIASGTTERAVKSRVAVANVAESDTPLFHVGQPVKVSVLAYPGQVFEGRISKIYAVVDPNTHRTKIRAKVADPRNNLRPGMLASVTIRVQGPLEAVAVPANGVVREGDGTMAAWTTSDCRHFQQRTVKLGLQTDGLYQVVEGLKPGDLAVTEGGIFLSNMLDAPPSD